MMYTRECKGLLLTLKVTCNTRLNKVSGPEWKYALDKFKQVNPIPASNIHNIIQIHNNVLWYILYIQSECEEYSADVYQPHRTLLCI